MEISDNDIIKTCIAGDTEQFSILYNRYIRKIYNFIYYKTNHQEIAEDLTSQVFMKALDKLATLKHENFSAWIYTIARNTVIDYYRTKKDLIDIDDVWDLSDKHDLIAGIDANEGMAELRNYMQTLKADERDILIMRFWQDMSFKEIAEILGKTEGACKMKLGRILKKLREDMPALLMLIYLIKLNI